MRAHGCDSFVLALLLASPAVAANLSAGALEQRALEFHEACFEARLSLDRPAFAREWDVLVQYLKRSLNGKAGFTVTGNPDDWRIQLSPATDPFLVSAMPAGVQLRARDGREASTVRNLLSVYPLRRHYDCSGKALAPRTPGIPAHGQPCAPPERPQAIVKTIAAMSEEGAVVVPVLRMPSCYKVVSTDGRILEPGQILVKQTQNPYKLRALADDKMRLLYRENTTLFVMDRKQPKLFSLELH
jgi:hypothetical protein